MDKRVDTVALLQGLVEESIAKTSGIDEATAHMQRRVEQDDLLFRALMTPLLHDACYDKIRGQFRRERQQIWTAPGYTKGGNGHRIAAVRSLYDFKLPHNLMLLGDATKEEVIAGAEWYSKAGNNMLNKARWLEAVANRVGSGTVRQKLSEDSLRKLQEQFS